MVGNWQVWTCSRNSFVTFWNFFFFFFFSELEEKKIGVKIIILFLMFHSIIIEVR